MSEVICGYDDGVHQSGLVALWRDVFKYSDPHSVPHFVLHKKLAVNDDLLFVAEAEGRVVGSIMAGYDGHRGWLYALAVLPDHRGKGIGTRLVRFAEDRLRRLGCPKINLQIYKGNEAVESFYLRLGYETEQRVSMGKTVRENIDGVEPSVAARPPSTFPALNDLPETAGTDPESGAPAGGELR